MKTLVIIALLLIMPFMVSSQWSTDPAVNNAINTMSGEQAIPKIATCPNGDTYIAFFSNESGNYNVRMQRLNAQGVEQWTTNGILISDNLQDSWLTDWDMAADPSNHAILVFPDIRNGGANVVAYRISPSGSFVWGDDGIVISSGASNYSPKVTVTAAGNAIVAWQQDANLHIQKIGPTGSLPWGSGGITLSQTGITFSWPQLLPVGTDEFIIKYYQDTGTFPAITRHIYAQKYNAGGSAVWSSPTVVSNAGGISAWTQVLSMINDGSDGFYIAWHDDRDNNQLASAYVHHISNSGAALFTTNGVEASTMSGRNHYYPHLSLPPGSSNVFVFWNEMDANQNNRGIYGQKFNAAGTRLWASTGMVFIEISSTNVYPFAASQSNTDEIFFYEEYSNSVDAQIKAMRIDNDGGFVWSPASRTVCSVISEKVHLVANDFQNNQWIISWEDDRNGQKDIYAQNIQLDGTLGPYDPQEGIIEGIVTLVGGSASVTQVNVSAGEFSTNPDENGFYSMIVSSGTYEVFGNLTGYIPDTVSGVVVVTDQTTGNVNLTLQALPTGFITGNVTLNGGEGDVTDVEVVAGYHVINPDSDGNYIMEIEIGTYDVTAQLAGYVPDTDTGIVVLDGMTTVGVDFVLDPVPTTGFITGIVELQDENDDVTMVNVTAGSVTVNPDASGFYTLEIVAGTYEVTASREGYLTGVVQGVVVEVEQTTPDIDFYLYLAPNVGYIEGFVSLVNGEGDVTEATVSAGGQSDNPSENGYYALSLPAGTYTVTATHPYTLSDSLTGITLETGQTITDVNFELEIVRADLVCKATDQYGGPLSPVEVEITGPEGTVTGLIEGDSIIFSNLPYGMYDGVGVFTEADTAWANDELNAEDHEIVFVFQSIGIDENAAAPIYSLKVSPNPSSETVILSFKLDKPDNLSLKVLSSQGQLIKSLADQKFDIGSYSLAWNGCDETGKLASPGVYMIVLQTSSGKSTASIIRINR